ncbi:MAG: glycosyltransferase family 4 protein [Methylococcales bacterium]
MRFAFCLFKYFPYGGLERNFRNIAQQCLQHGHQVDVYTRHWETEVPHDITINVLPVTATTNHSRDRQFVAQLAKRLATEDYAGIVGFNKMPGLDVYYAADTCYAAIAATKPWYYRLTPRYKHYSAFENAVFGVQNNTQIMTISAAQTPNFKYYYQTENQRFSALPPGINPDRKAPHNLAEIRQSWRDEFNIGADEFVVLAVGADFKRKGLARTLYAVTALPEAVRNKTHLFAIGDSRNKPYQKLAQQLNIEQQLHCLEGRDDIPRFLFGADCLAHPAHIETAGNIILEAIIAGLPVIATETCGFAFHIQRAQAGLVITQPFEQHTYNKLLLKILTSQQRKHWHHSGIQYGMTEDLYQRSQVATDIIEKIALQKRCNKAPVSV